MKNKTEKIQLLLGAYVMLLLLANLLGAKVISFIGLSVSVGIFMVPLSFLITDIISEVEGKEVAARFVKIGLAVLVFTTVFTYIATILPPHERFEFNSEYVAVFGLSLRFTIASIIAFAFSQLSDVVIFHRLKKKTAGKMLWLRNNISTFISQAIDTTLFIFLAYWGTSPRFTIEFMFELILTYLGIKIAFAILDTPLVYAGVRWLRNDNKQ